MKKQRLGDSRDPEAPSAARARTQLNSSSGVGADGGEVILSKAESAGGAYVNLIGSIGE